MKISWEEYKEDAKLLSKIAVSYGPFRGLLAVERGGLIPAASLAYLLGIKYIHTIKVDKEEPCLYLPEASFTNYSQWLIIDEIVDSGKTISLLKDYYKNTAICAVYVKEKSQHLVDFSAKVLPDDTPYIVFPWEDN